MKGSAFMDSHEKTIDVILAEYACLRAEICLRIRAQFFVFAGAIAIVTALAGIVRLAYETPDYTDYEKLLNLVVPFIFSADTIFYYDQDVTMSHLARYINGHLRPSVIALIARGRGDPEETAEFYGPYHKGQGEASRSAVDIIYYSKLLGWEQYIGSKRSARLVFSAFFWISLGRFMFLFLPGAAAWTFFLVRIIDSRCFALSLSIFEWVLFVAGGLTMALCLIMVIWVGRQYQSFT